MSNTVKYLFLAIMLFTFSGCAIGCSSNSTLSTTSTNINGTGLISATNAAIQTYADPEAVIILQGLSADNLAKYTQYGDSEFKASTTKTVLDEYSNEITTTYGTYVSVEFQSAEQQQDYILVYFTAYFSKGNFIVQLAFDTNHKVDDVSYMISGS
jgi:hypothetical protein